MLRRATHGEYRFFYAVGGPYCTQGQVITLHMEIQDLLAVMAKELVYAGSAEPFTEPNGLPEVALIGADPRC